MILHGTSQHKTMLHSHYLYLYTCATLLCVTRYLVNFVYSCEQRWIRNFTLYGTVAANLMVVLLLMSHNNHPGTIDEWNQWEDYGIINIKLRKENRFSSFWSLWEYWLPLYLILGCVEDLKGSYDERPVTFLHVFIENNMIYTDIKNNMMLY